MRRRRCGWFCQSQSFQHERTEIGINAVAVDEFVEAMLCLGVVPDRDERDGLGLGIRFELLKKGECIRRAPVEDDRVGSAAFGGADGFQEHGDNGAEHLRVIERGHNGRSGLGAAGEQEDFLQSACRPQVEGNVLEFGSALGEEMACTE